MAPFERAASGLISLLLEIADLATIALRIHGPDRIQLLAHPVTNLHGPLLDTKCYRRSTKTHAGERSVHWTPVHEENTISANAYIQ